MVYCQHSCIKRCYLSNLIFDWLNYIDKHVGFATPEHAVKSLFINLKIFKKRPIQISLNYGNIDNDIIWLEM